MQVVFDTGSEWLVLATDLCLDCQHQTFHSQNSSTFEAGQDFTTLDYGSDLFIGYESQELVCFTQEYCAQNMTFLATTNATGFSDRVAGIVGMTSGSPYRNSSSEHLLVN
jgi:hypothetical protein